MRKHLLTAAVLTGLLIVARFGRFKPGPVAHDPDPQSTVYEMLNAAKAGDVERYLAAFSEPMAGSVKPMVSTQSLREGHSAIKGVAIANTDTEGRLQVQFVYQDRTESQTFVLERDAARRWKIASMDGAREAKVLVPYGTPVHLQK